ncbi:hypothetical protein E2C01_088751 [Portunus trituberculatus]|uniref:Uncharacterized protein n=1 Tax=Portunus trituberculatus TaxID=210409 RepID=A0A5B7JK97_PORTR|nr:hypothetical protein [Portunus trituberculatus]
MCPITEKINRPQTSGAHNLPTHSAPLHSTLPPHSTLPSLPPLQALWPLSSILFILHALEQQMTFGFSALDEMLL